MEQELSKNLRKMADHAHERAVGYYVDAQEAEKGLRTERNIFERALLDTTRQAKLNDYFYWSGKATAYAGVAAGLELRGIVEDEIDEEPSCP